MEPTSRNQAAPSAPSSMAQIMSKSDASSRPTSSHSTLSTLSNNSTTSLASTLTSFSNTTSAPKWNIHKPQYDANGKALDAMGRKYPVSEQQLSVEEMLALPPLPRSFHYEIARNEAEKKLRLEKSEEKRKEELEAAKKKLRDLALGVK